MNLDGGSVEIDIADRHVSFWYGALDLGVLLASQDGSLGLRVGLGARCCFNPFHSPCIARGVCLGKATFSYQQSSSTSFIKTSSHDPSSFGIKAELEWLDITRDVAVLALRIWFSYDGSNALLRGSSSLDESLRRTLQQVTSYLTGTNSVYSFGSGTTLCTSLPSAPRPHPEDHVGVRRGQGKVSDSRTLPNVMKVKKKTSLYV